MCSMMTTLLPSVVGATGAKEVLRAAGPPLVLGKDAAVSMAKAVGPPLLAGWKMQASSLLAECAAKTHQPHPSQKL